MSFCYSACPLTLRVLCIKWIADDNEIRSVSLTLPISTHCKFSVRFCCRYWSIKCFSWTSSSDLGILLSSCWDWNAMSLCCSVHPLTSRVVCTSCCTRWLWTTGATSSPATCWKPCRNRARLCNMSLTSLPSFRSLCTHLVMNSGILWTLHRFISLPKGAPRKHTRWSENIENVWALIFYLFFVIELSHWDSFHGKFGLLSPRESQLWQICTSQPTVRAGCFNVSIIHQTLTWTTGSFRCAQILMHAVAHSGVWTL